MKRLRSLDADALRAALRLAQHAGGGHAHYLHRLHAVMLVSQGCSCQQVADWFGDDLRSVERWSRACELAGAEALGDHHGAGRPARLSAALQAQWQQDVALPPAVQGYDHARWSGKLLARHLSRKFNVVFSQRHCQSLLRACRR